MNAATQPQSTVNMSPAGPVALQGTKHFPKVSRPTLRERMARILPSKWERVIVNEKIDSVTMPKWIASAILIAMLAFVVQSWWARSADHDALVRIEQKFNDEHDARKEKDGKFDQALADLNAWKTVNGGTSREILGMLKQQQIDSIDQSNKKPRE